MGVKQSNPYLKLNPPPFPFRIRFFLLTFICSLFFFILGFYSNNNSNKLLSKPYFQDPFCPKFNFTTLSISTTSTTSVSLDFNPHHRISLPLLETTSFEPKFCDQNLTEYIPCHDPSRENQFDVEKKFYRERHCPERDDEISRRCLVPIPVGYRTPLQWPKSKNFVWFDNVPSKWLTVYKKSQNWVRLEGDRLTFPGGGTSFRMGVKDYIDEIKRFVPLKSGTVRTVLDVGCGVATFGASLMDYNILTMSIAPRDIHEAQVQFALERGLPAMLGILSVHRLPYPSRSFDMAHCGRCLVPWTNYDGMYLMEIDRVLRPGGYWVLSGPPISGKHNKKGLQKQASDLEKEHASLEDLARRMCWKKIAERGTIAVWRKPTNHVHCIQNSKTWKSPRFCDATDSDAGWYKKMEPCVTPLPRVKDIKGISGGGLEKWPKRLNSDPPRIRNGISKEITVRTFQEDNKTWNRRVVHYGKILVSLSSGKYRNIMDMNAQLGGFAAALSKYQVWVMNVVPFDAKPYTLGVIYERGLIGTYTNWCEAFSTYPRTYDLIHADGVFGMYMNKCDIVDILFEMYRILRPEGAVIIRDHVDVIVKVKGFAERMKWNTTMQHSERGPSYPEKVLFIDNSKESETAINYENHV